MSVQQRRVFSLFTWIGNKWTISIKFLFSSFCEFLARDLKKEKTKFPGRFEWRMKRNEELFRSGRDSTCWVRVRNDPKSRYPLHTHTHRDTCISCKLVERKKGLFSSSSSFSHWKKSVRERKRRRPAVDSISFPSLLLLQLRSWTLAMGATSGGG